MKTLLTLLALALVATAPFALTQDTKDAAAKTEQAPDEAAIIAAQLPSYPMGNCVVSDEPMGGDHGEPINVVHEGRLFRLCCKMCKKMLAQSPEEYVAKLDAAIIAEQTPYYALETCAISGEPLDGMGGAIDTVVGTRLVKVCCKGCIKGVQKNPAEALAKVDAAMMEAQAESYPLETCVISGEPLGSMGEAISTMYGYRLVKVCCKGCIKGVQKKGHEVIAKLDAAAK